MSQGFLTLNSASIQQRVDLYAVPKALINAQPWLMLEKLGSRTDLPKNKGENITWQRMVPFEVTTDELVEGVTPAPLNFQKEDVTNRIRQFGAHVAITDKMQDLHSDVKLTDISTELVKRAATQKELLTWEAIRGGTQNIFSGTATTRATVADIITLDEVRKATNVLANNHGEFLTSMIGGSQNQATEPVQPSYVAVGHRDQDGDLRDMDKFVESHKYGGPNAVLNKYEIGSCEGIRFCLTPHLEPFFGAGATATATERSRDGVDLDVYSTVVMAQNFFGITNLAGAGNVKVNVRPAGEVTQVDPLGQRGFASYIFYYCVTRLNERWGVRIEAACSV